MIILGLAILLSVLQLIFGGGVLLFVPGAGTGLHVMHWFGVLAALGGRLLIGSMLLAIGAQYAKGKLCVPANGAARIGRALAAWGLVATVLFVVWQAWVWQAGPQASIFRVFGPVNFWLIFLITGVVLVEGSRVLDLARAGESSSTLKTADAARALEEMGLGTCPNCSARLPLTAPECLTCGALFGEGAVWKVQRT